MKLLKDILYGVSVEAVVGSTSQQILTIEFDSRQVAEGTLFVAQKGLNVDGHDFIDSSVDKGARAVICEEFPMSMREGVTYIRVADSQNALARAASNFCITTTVPPA